MKLLVFGQQGQLAKAVGLQASIAGMDVTLIGRAGCDITDAGAVEACLRQLRPDAVLNAAAFTAVDAAETQVEAAKALNTTAPEILAKATARKGIAFLHVSTDYVFDGTKPEPYVETDLTHPLNVYGATKRNGELAVQASHPSAVIVRTSWVFSPFAHNFVRTILSRATSGAALSVVDDQIGAPTSALDLAQACLTALQKVQAGSSSAGLFHYTSAGRTSWHGFAQSILDQTRDWRGGRDVELQAISTNALKAAAVRPRNSCLNCAAFLGQFGHPQPNWQDSLAATLSALEPEFGAHP
jgi:dTDP-4-dehydrorhamnose reductase